MVRAGSSAALEQVSRFDSKCFGYASEHQHARIAFSALDASGIGKVDFGIEGELLLRQSRLNASPPHIRPNNYPPISHAPEERRRAYIL